LGDGHKHKEPILFPIEGCKNTKEESGREKSKSKRKTKRRQKTEERKRNGK
jgi:hypothetical protein